MGASSLLTPGAPRRSSHVLSMRDLSEIKTLKKPPPPIRMLMEVCCLLFNIAPMKQADEMGLKRCIDYWEPARRYLLSDTFFLSKLRDFDVGQLPQSQRAKVMQYFRDPDFTAERVRNCSKAAYELYEWVRAIVVEEPDAACRHGSDPRAVRAPTTSMRNA